MGIEKTFEDFWDRWTRCPRCKMSDQVRFASSNAWHTQQWKVERVLKTLKQIHGIIDARGNRGFIKAEIEETLRDMGES